MTVSFKLYFPAAFGKSRSFRPLSFNSPLRWASSRIRSSDLVNWLGCCCCIWLILDKTPLPPEDAPTLIVNLLFVADDMEPLFDRETAALCKPIPTDAMFLWWCSGSSLLLPPSIRHFIRFGNENSIGLYFEKERRGTLHQKPAAWMRIRRRFIKHLLRFGFYDLYIPFLCFFISCETRRDDRAARPNRRTASRSIYV